jgi:putative ABC transport system permease protein
MIGRIQPVTSVTATGKVGVHVYRNDHIPPEENGSIAVLAARTDLPDTIGATLAGGSWLNAATAQYPAVVLGPRQRNGSASASPAPTSTCGWATGGLPSSEYSTQCHWHPRWTAQR